MLPLFDLIMGAQNGKAMETMAQQFGLAQEQMAKATAALMPAFATGLTRSAANPYDFTALMSALSTGTHAQYFEDLARAFTPQGMADGNGILGQLFGSKEMSRAIAAQAAQVTGIGQEIFKQMLPVMASTIMGGLLKQSAGAFPGMPNAAFPANPMAAMTEQWMKAAGMTRPPEPAANPFDNAFTQAMQGMFAAGRPEPKPDAFDMFAGNPLMKAFQDMMAAATPQPAPEPKEAAPMEQASRLFGNMMESGLEAQRDYQKSIDALFETYRGPSTGPDKS